MLQHKLASSIILGQPGCIKMSGKMVGGWVRMKRSQSLRRRVVRMDRSSGLL